MENGDFGDLDSTSACPTSMMHAPLAGLQTSGYFKQTPRIGSCSWRGPLYFSPNFDSLFRRCLERNRTQRASIGPWVDMLDGRD